MRYLKEIKKAFFFFLYLFSIMGTKILLEQQHWFRGSAKFLDLADGSNISPAYFSFSSMISDLASDLAWQSILGLLTWKSSYLFLHFYVS